MYTCTYAYVYLCTYLCVYIYYADFCPSIYLSISKDPPKQAPLFRLVDQFRGSGATAWLRCVPDSPKYTLLPRL